MGGSSCPQFVPPRWEVENCFAGLSFEFPSFLYSSLSFPVGFIVSVSPLFVFFMDPEPFIANTSRTVHLQGGVSLRHPRWGTSRCTVSTVWRPATLAIGHDFCCINVAFIILITPLGAALQATWSAIKVLKKVFSLGRFSLC